MTIIRPNRPKFQSRLRNRTAGGVVAITAAGFMAAQTVGGFEGLRLAAYRDVVGIWTACYGETKGIVKGMIFTKEQCTNMLVESLEEHEKGMRLCMLAQPKPVNPDSLPIQVYVAFVSLTYNIGTGGFCGSGVMRAAKAGDLRAACNAIMSWNKAGRPLRVIKGLTTRREAERTLCLKGVA